MISGDVHDVSPVAAAFRGSVSHNGLTEYFGYCYVFKLLVEAMRSLAYFIWIDIATPVYKLTTTLA